MYGSLSRHTFNNLFSFLFSFNIYNLFVLSLCLCIYFFFFYSPPSPPPPPPICLFTSYLLMRWSTIHLFYFKYDLHYSEYLKRRTSIIFNTQTLTNSTETCRECPVPVVSHEIAWYLGDYGWTSWTAEECLAPTRQVPTERAATVASHKGYMSLRTRATCRFDCTYCCLPSYQEQTPYHVIMCLWLEIMDWMLSAMSSSCVKMSNTPLFRLIMDRMLSTLFSSCVKMSNTMLSKLNIDWMLCRLFQLFLFCAVKNRGHNHYVCVTVRCGR